jgi:hypothetical protein
MSDETIPETDCVLCRDLANFPKTEEEKMRRRRRWRGCGSRHAASMKCYYILLHGTRDGSIEGGRPL